MVPRLSFALITVFWVTMNVLLWRAEYGSGDAAGSPVPVEVVWRKILTAPDASTLNIRQHGKTVGFCRWSTAVSEEFADMDEAPSSGTIEPLKKYRVRFDGNFSFSEPKDNVRFESNLKLSNRTDWDEFNLRVRYQVLTASLRSRAAEQAVRLSITNGEDVVERVFSFADLQNPQAMLGLLAAPLGANLPEGLELPTTTPASRPGTEAIQWRARFDTLYISHQPTRVYRIDGRIANRFDVVLYISRVGEIFKVELPAGIVLVHDRLLTYTP